MLKFTLEQANDQNLATALQKLAGLEKIDVKIRYRAGRIFDTIGSSMRAHALKMEALRKDFVHLENGKPKMSKDGQVIWNTPTAQEEYHEIIKASMKAQEVVVKSLPLDFAELAKIDSLTGSDLVGLEIVSDGVPKVA